MYSRWSANQLEDDDSLRKCLGVSLHVIMKEGSDLFGR